jgi:hypothetical protein
MKPQPAAGTSVVAGVELSLRGVELGQQAALGPVRQPELPDLRDERGDRRPRGRRAHERVDRHSDGSGGAGDEALVGARAIEVRPADRVGAPLGPVNVVAVDRHPFWLVGAGDEALVSAGAVEIRPADGVDAVVGPVDVLFIDRRPPPIAPGDARDDCSGPLAGCCCAPEAIIRAVDLPRSRGCRIAPGALLRPGPPKDRTWRASLAGQFSTWDPAFPRDGTTRLQHKAHAPDPRRRARDRRRGRLRRPPPAPPPRARSSPDTSSMSAEVVTEGWGGNPVDTALSDVRLAPQVDPEGGHRR